jgi:hypothetical protein
MVEGPGPLHHLKVYDEPATSLIRQSWTLKEG